MNRSLVSAAVLAMLASSIANAGVVMEIVTRDATGSESDRTKIYSEAGKIRMEQGGEQAGDASMIFLGDRFIYVDHSSQSYMIMDEAMLEQVSNKMNEAMKEMEAQLAAMPPEQRAMVEQMMQGQMQGMMGHAAEEKPKVRVEATGSGEWNSRKCREYAVFTGDEKTQQVCAADLDDVDGSREMVDAFRDMAAYIQKMTESMPMVAGNQPNPGELMDQIGGFPVLTVDFANGVKISESSLDSVVEENLDDSLFEAPDGYQRREPF